MAARALWKARLVLGKKTIPVDLLAAIADRDLHLHLLHDVASGPGDGEAGRAKRPKSARGHHATNAPRERVRQQMVDAATGEPVEPDAIRRGVEVERGRFVLLDADEIAAVEPEPSRDVTVAAFVPARSVDHRWYDRPYYLAPGRGHEAEYAALVAAMTKAQREGFARWVMRKREYAGMVRAHEGALVLITLRHANEVIVASQLPAPEGRELEKRELDLAAQLVGALSGPFEHAQFRDEYRERVLELVGRKRKGQTIDVVRWRAKPVADDSLVDALRRGLDKAG